MGFFDFLRRKKPVEPADFQDRLKLAIQRQDPDPSVLETTIKERRRQPQPVVFYTLQGRSASSRIIPNDRDSRGVEIGSVYDLAEIIKLQDIESYFATSVDRHVELIMKDGYYLEGKNPETIEYIERRLDEISWVSNQPFAEILREITRNCVVAANGFGVLKRDASRSSGRRIRMWGRDLDPISAIYVPDPSSMRCQQNKTGHIFRWIQTIDQEKRFFPYPDVIHIPIKKKSSFVFGTPYVVPVLEDIRALRKLEMLAEHVAHKFAFPMMHWKVGTEEHPATMIADPMTGESIAETLAAENIAKMMEQEGFACTSERHEIKFLGVEGEMLDMDPFIKHYEMRVLGGLRLSEIDLGRGDTANRGTAKVISQILVDACREMQETIRTSINGKLLNILLLEGGYDISPENRVYLNFPPIDKEEERAQETHGMLLYQSGGITLSELRQEYLGRNPMTETEQSDTFLKNWLEPLAKAKPPAGASGSTKSSSAVKSVALPSNQYGQGVKPKLPANDIVDLLHADGAYLQLVADKSLNVYDHVSGTTERVLETTRKHLEDAWEAGIEQAKIDTGLQVDKSAFRNEFKQFIESRWTPSIQDTIMSALLAADVDMKAGTLPQGGCLIGPLNAGTSILVDRFNRTLDAAKRLGYLYVAKRINDCKLKFTFADQSTQEYPIDEPGLDSLVQNPLLSGVSVIRNTANE